MHLAGRKPTVEPNKKHKEYEAALAAIIVDGHLVKSSSRIYYDLAKTLLMSKQAIYMSVKRYVRDYYPSTEIEDKMAIDQNEDDEADLDFVPSSVFEATNPLNSLLMSRDAIFSEVLATNQIMTGETNC